MPEAKYFAGSYSLGEDEAQFFDHFIICMAGSAEQAEGLMRYELMRLYGDDGATSWTDSGATLGFTTAWGHQLIFFGAKEIPQAEYAVLKKYLPDVTD